MLMRIVDIALWISGVLAALAGLTGIVYSALLRSPELANVAFAVSVTGMATFFLITVIGLIMSRRYPVD